MIYDRILQMRALDCLKAKEDFQTAGKIQLKKDFNLALVFLLEETSHGAV